MVLAGDDPRGAERRAVHDDAGHGAGFVVDVREGRLVAGRVFLVVGPANRLDVVGSRCLALREFLLVEAARDPRRST